MSDNPVPRYAGVFGGGGLFGIGYGLGVVDGLRTRGIDLHGSPMLGTSAGSWVAAATALQVSFETLVALPVPTFPNPRAGVLAETAALAFGQHTDPLVSVVVTQVPRLRRTVLNGADIPLAQLVAASSAVPGLLAPQRINDKRYVDGGVRSAVSVDLAPAAHTLVIITPLAGAMFGPFGRYVDHRTDQQQKEWHDEHGGTFIEFSPKATTADVASLPHHLFDQRRAVEAYHRGFDEATSMSLTP
jgi:predicted acylesterase/phospholipase RssA